MIEWIIAHRGEPECEEYLTALAVIADNETVEETLCHIWAGFYDAENPQEELLAKQIRKNNSAIRRERKLADNRRHYAKVCERKGY